MSESEIGATAAPAWISCRQYAKRRGVSAMAVSMAISSGRLSKSVVRIDGVPKIADPDLADQEWEANTDPQRRVNAAGGNPLAWTMASVTVRPGSPAPRAVTDENEHDAEDLERVAALPEIGTSTARAKHWDAELRELKFKQAAGELVPIANVKRRVIEVLTGTKARLLAIPTRARQALPSLSNDDAIEIEKLVREAIEDLERDPL